jgi:hypothetical protein
MAKLWQKKQKPHLRRLSIRSNMYITCRFSGCFGPLSLPLHAINEMKRSRIKNSLIACFVLTSLLMGCKARPQIYNHSKAFIILKNAEGTFCDLRDGGAIQLSYKLKKDYPASSVLKEISTQLEGAGWQPLKKDYLNPGLPSSYVKGWSDFEDATRPPTTIKVYQWRAVGKTNTGTLLPIFSYMNIPRIRKRSCHICKFTKYTNPRP